VTLGPAKVTELLARHAVTPSRALGQNFVVDANTVRRVAAMARVGPGDRVVEIGAGVGCLTLALLETGATVTTIEVDRHLAPVLEEVLGGTAARVVIADARHLDWGDVLGGEQGVLVANLPYNVGTPLLADLLDDVPDLVRFVVMVQDEVADRLVAEPRTKAYGALTVKVASWAVARRLAAVPPTVFLPRPRVRSAVVELVRHPESAVPDDVDREAMERLVRIAFGQRRKMLRRSLAGVVEPEAYGAAGVGPEQRPEELDLAGWVALTRASAAP